jgi:hypothetical protein
MNFKFDEDIENNSLTISVTIPLRKTLKEERKRVKFDDVVELVKQNYSAPETHKLGQCVSNMSIRLDNDYTNTLSGSWIFSLVPKKVVVKKTKTTSTRKTKTSRTKKA